MAQVNPNANFLFQQQQPPPTSIPPQISSAAAAAQNFQPPVEQLAALQPAPNPSNNNLQQQLLAALNNSLTGPTIQQLLLQQILQPSINPPPNSIPLLLPNNNISQEPTNNVHVETPSVIPSSVFSTTTLSQEVTTPVTKVVQVVTNPIISSTTAPPCNSPNVILNSPPQVLATQEEKQIQESLEAENELLELMNNQGVYHPSKATTTNPKKRKQLTEENSGASKKPCLVNAIPTNSSKVPANYSRTKTVMPKKKMYVERESRPLSPESLQMFKDGLKENHRICEQNGVIVEATGPAEGQEQLTDFASLRNWSSFFKMSPRATVKQLMTMGNMFDFFVQTFNKMQNAMFKLMMDMGRVKDKNLTPEQESDCEAIERFLQRIESDKNFVQNVQETEEGGEEGETKTRFLQECTNCVKHGCENLESDDELDPDDFECMLCPVHKCVEKFKESSWNFTGRPAAAPKRPRKINEAKEIKNKASKTKKMSL